MKKLSRIIVCFILVVALVLSTAACKPTKPTPEVTPTPTPVVTATPTPEKTPTPVTPTPTPTKTPDHELTFPDGWDKPTVTKNDVTAEQASALTGNGTYYLNPKTGDSVTNEAFTGTLIVENKTALDTLTVDMPNATIEFKGEYKDLTVTSGQHTARFAPSARITGKLTILGGNVLAEALAEIKTLEVPVANTTTSNVQLLGALLTTFSTATPINLTFQAPAKAQAQAPTFTNSASGTVLEVIGSVTSLAVTNTTDKSLVVDVTNATQATGEKLAVTNNNGTVLVVGEKPAGELIDHGTSTPPTKLETIADLAVSADPTFAISGTDKLTTSFAVTATANFGTKDIKGVVVELYAGDKLVSANEMTAKGLAAVFATPGQTFTIATSEFFPIATTDANAHWAHSAALITAGAKPTKIKVVVTPHVGTAVSNEKVLATPLDDTAYKAIFTSSVIAKDFVVPQVGNTGYIHRSSELNFDYGMISAGFTFKSDIGTEKAKIQSLTVTLKFANGKEVVQLAKLSAWSGASMAANFYLTDGLLNNDVKAFRSWYTSAPAISLADGRPESITVTVTDKSGNKSVATNKIENIGSAAIADSNKIVEATFAVDYPKYANELQLIKDAQIAKGATLTIPAEVTLTIPTGKVLTNSGTIVNNGTIIYGGIIDGTGTVSGSGNIINIIKTDEKLISEVTKAVASGAPTTIVSNIAKTPQEILEVVKGITGIADKNIVIENTNNGELYYLAFALKGLYQKLCTEGLTNVWLATEITEGKGLIAINNKATISYSYDGVNFEKMPFAHEVIGDNGSTSGSENQTSTWAVDKTKEFVWFKIESVVGNSFEISWQHSNGGYNVVNVANGEAVKISVSWLNGVYGKYDNLSFTVKPCENRQCVYKNAAPYTGGVTNTEAFVDKFVGNYKSKDGQFIAFKKFDGINKGLIGDEVLSEDGTTPAWVPLANPSYTVNTSGGIVTTKAQLAGYSVNAYFTISEDYKTIKAVDNYSYCLNQGENASLTGKIAINTEFIYAAPTSVDVADETALEAALKKCDDTINVTADITITKKLMISPITTLIIPTGKTLTINNGITIVNNGTIEIKGTLAGKGTVDNTNGIVGVNKDADFDKFIVKPGTTRLDSNITSYESVPLGSTLLIPEGKILNLKTSYFNGKVVNNGTIVNGNQIMVTNPDALQAAVKGEGYVTIQSAVAGEPFVLTEDVDIGYGAIVQTYTSYHTLEIPNGKTLTVKDGGSLTVAEDVGSIQGSTLRVLDGGKLTVEVGGTAEICENSTFERASGATITIKGSLVIANLDHVFYLAKNETEMKKELDDGHLAAGHIVKISENITLNDNYTVTNAKLIIPEDQWLNIVKGKTLTIGDGATLERTEDSIEGKVATTGTGKVFYGIKDKDGNSITEKLRAQFAIGHNVTLINQNNSIRLEGNVPTTLEIPAGVTLDIPYGKEISIEKDVTLINNGTIINNGIITNKGTIVVNGKLDNKVTIKNGGILEIGIGATLPTGTITPESGGKIVYDVANEADMRAALSTKTHVQLLGNNTVSLTEALEIPTGKTLIIDAGATLTIPAGVKLTNVGTGKIIKNATGSISNNGTIEIGATDVTAAENNLLVALAAGGKTVVASGAPTGFGITLMNNATVLSGGELSLGDNITIDASGYYSLIVDKGAKFTLGANSKVEGKLLNAVETEVELIKQIQTTDVKISKNFTLANDLTIAAGKAVMIGNGATLTIPDGKKLTISGKLILEAGGSLKTTGTGAIVNTAGIDVYDENGFKDAAAVGGKINIGNDFTIANDIVATKKVEITVFDGKMLTIADDKALKITGDSTIAGGYGAKIKGNLTFVVTNKDQCIATAKIKNTIVVDGVRVVLGDDIELTSGTILKVTGNGPATLIIPNGKTLTIANGATLGSWGNIIVEQGGTLTNAGTINFNQGKIANAGAIANSGTITNDGTYSGEGTVTNTGILNGARPLVPKA